MNTNERWSSISKAVRGQWGSASKLSVDAYILLLNDVDAVMSEKGIDAGDAAWLLNSRIGGERHLVSYTESLLALHPFERKPSER